MENEQGDLGILLGRTTHLMGKSIGKKFQEAQLDLTMEQFALLDMLHTSNHTIQQELAEFMKKDKSAVLRVVAALEQRQLVSRTADAVDRRKKHLEITPKGKETFLKAKAISNEVLSYLQQGLSQEELGVFQHVGLHFQQQATALLTNT